MKVYKHEGSTGNNMRLRRLMAVLLDAFLCLMAGYVCYVMLWTCVGVDYTQAIQSLKHFLIDAAPIYLTFFFLKDIFGRSLGKVIFGLCIVKKGTGAKAGFGSRFFRNFSLILFPVEGIALLMSESNTRIADKLLGIEVVKKA